jgi:hypothetical protein
MLFSEDYQGPLSAGANAYSEWTYDEFERRAEAVLGPRWGVHLKGLFGLSSSAIHQYKQGPEKGRAIPRRVAFVIGLLEALDAAGGEIPYEFCDYEMPVMGRPRKDAEEEPED